MELDRSGEAKTSHSRTSEYRLSPGADPGDGRRIPHQKV